MKLSEVLPLVLYLLQKSLISCCNLPEWPVEEIPLVQLLIFRSRLKVRVLGFDIEVAEASIVFPEDTLEVFRLHCLRDELLLHSISTLLMAQVLELAIRDCVDRGFLEFAGERDEVREVCRHGDVVGVPRITAHDEVLLS